MATSTATTRAKLFDYSRYVDKSLQLFNTGCEKVEVICHLLAGLGRSVFIEPNRKRKNIHLLHMIATTQQRDSLVSSDFTTNVLCERSIPPPCVSPPPSRKKPSRVWPSFKKLPSSTTSIKNGVVGLDTLYHVVEVTFNAPAAADAEQIITSALSTWWLPQVASLDEQMGWLLVPADISQATLISATSALSAVYVLYKQRHLKRGKDVNEKIYNEIIQKMDIPFVVFDLRIHTVATTAIDPGDMICTFVNAAFRDLIGNMRLDTSPHDQQYSDRSRHVFSDFLSYEPIQQCLLSVMNVKSDNKLSTSQSRKLSSTYGGGLAAVYSTSGSLQCKDESITISLEYGDDIIPRRHYEFHIYRVNGTRVGVVLKDISEKIEHLRLIEQASRAKTEFLANMNHEFRTPLNSIDGNLQLLMRTNPLTDRQLDLIHRMRLSGTALMSLLQEVLDYAKLEQHKMTLNIEAFSLRHCLQSSIDVMTSAANGRKVLLNYNIRVNVPTLVMGDSFRLQQILVNLLSNAINFTHSGSVVIDVSPSSTDHILFSVTDTGTGVDEEARRNLFDAWTQGNPRRARATRGTGLGLAICKELVTLMDGNIWLEDTSDKGSTFAFTAALPSANLNSSVAETEMNVLKGKQIIILHTDDNVKRELVKLLLSWGIRPTCCTSFEEIVNYLAAGYEFHLSLLELRGACEPHSDIISLASWITLNQPHLPLVGMTTDPRETFNEKCVELFRTVVSGQAEAEHGSTLFNILVNILGGNGNVKKNPRSLSKRRQHLAPKNGNIAILVVEDVAENQLVLLDMLNVLGYVNVTVAGNGIEMLEHLAKSNFSLVLVDLLMPEMDGIDAVREYRQRYDKKLGTRPYIVAVTATNLISDDPKSYTAVGMDAFIQKPIKMNDLQTLLELV